MRLRVFIFVLVLVVCAATLAFADDAVQESAKILLKPNCSGWTNRDYKVDVAVKGKMLVPDGKEMMDVDSGFSLTLKHKYSRRGDDGLMPLEVTVTKGEAIIRDKENGTEQKMAISPGSYPKLTVLLDGDCRPTDIFGIPAKRYAEGLPGLNYGNMVILFTPDMGGQARAIGEKWETQLTIPSYQETYKFVNTLKSVDAAAKMAVIAQEITWSPKSGGNAGSQVNAAVESTFSTEDGKLVKSHAQCQVTQKAAGEGKESSSSQQEATADRTNISVDIALIK